MVDKAVSTEGFENVDVSESMEEIRQRLHELELSYLGGGAASSPGFGSSPFAPTTTLSRRIEELKATKRISEFDVKTSSRLPQIDPPKFDGTDLEGFSRDFLLWLRLTNLIKAEDSLKIDWVCQC